MNYWWIIVIVDQDNNWRIWVAKWNFRTGQRRAKNKTWRKCCSQDPKKMCAACARGLLQARHLLVSLEHVRIVQWFHSTLNNHSNIIENFTSERLSWAQLGSALLGEHTKWNCWNSDPLRKRAARHDENWASAPGSRDACRESPMLDVRHLIRLARAGGDSYLRHCLGPSSGTIPRATRLTLLRNLLRSAHALFSNYVAWWIFSSCNLPPILPESASGAFYVFQWSVHKLEVSLLKNSTKK